MYNIQRREKRREEYERRGEENERNCQDIREGCKVETDWENVQQTKALMES